MDLYAFHFDTEQAFDRQRGSKYHNRQTAYTLMRQTLWSWRLQCLTWDNSLEIYTVCDLSKKTVFFSVTHPDIEDTKMVRVKCGLLRFLWTTHWVKIADCLDDALLCWYQRSWVNKQWEYSTHILPISGIGINAIRKVILLSPEVLCWLMVDFDSLSLPLFSFLSQSVFLMAVSRKPFVIVTNMFYFVQRNRPLIMPTSRWIKSLN